MNSLYVRTVCIWVLYVRSFLAYPSQGTYVKNTSVGSVHTRKYDTELSPINLSRISHLSNIYYELVQARQTDDFLRDPNLDTISRQDFLKSLAKDDIDAEGSSFKTDDIDISESANSQVEQVNSRRSKRQQGWYIQYGKRNQRTLLSTRNHRTLISTNIKDDKNVNGLFTYSEDAPSKIAFSSFKSPLDDTGRPASAKSTLLKSTKLLQHFDDLTSATDFTNKHFYKNDPDDNDRVMNSVNDDGVRLEKSKRQQGWFISYGKRSNANV
ncbi:hypothetical protein BsWGS_19174 [Bradybaena similaris]